MSYSQLATPVNLTSTALVSVVAAGSSLQKVSITGFRASNKGTKVVDLLLYDGSTLRFRISIPPGPGSILALQDDPAMPIIPLDQMTVATALQAAINPGGDVWLNLYYRYAPTAEDT